jgi:ABC-type dipeptide/oligopeptide/nickel transport system ATPase subunit
MYRVFIKQLNSARKLYSLDTYHQDVNNIISGDIQSDYYESIFIYNDLQKAQIDAKKSAAGISDVVTDRLVFDFDNEDPGLALIDARNLSETLRNHFATNEIRSFFSGSKGFHIEVHFNTLITNTQFKNIVLPLGSKYNTFDQKIKDAQRVFRYPLTRHQKTGRYKIPLTYDELMSFTLDEIIAGSELTEENEAHFVETMNSFVVSSFDVKSLIKEEKKKETLLNEIDFSSEEILNKPDLSRKPKHMSDVKFVLQEGFFEEGERNEALVILAATYRYLGYNKEIAHNMLKATMRLRNRRLNLQPYDAHQIWLEVIEPVYGPNWKGGTFSENEGLLKKTIEKYKLNKTDSNLHELVDLNSVSDYFKDFALNIDKNTLKLGIDEVDSKLRITTGMLVSLLAAPGAGKSSIAMSILNTVSKNDTKAIFFSLDMSMQQTYQRLIQKHTAHQSDTIFNNYKNNNSKAIDNYKNIITNEYANVKFSFKSGLTVDGIREIIINEQNLTGVLPKLIVVDYLECVHGPFSDPTANKALIATQLKDIANHFSICVLLLVQPRLSAGGPAGELNSYTDIKGSSVLGEASAVVLTLSRPGFNPKNKNTDKFACITVVKNRMGELSSTDLGWDGLTGNVRILTSEEENDLQDLREQVKLGKEASLSNTIVGKPKTISRSFVANKRELY